MVVAKIPPIAIDIKLYEKLKVYSELENVSVSEKIRNLVKEYIDSKATQNAQDRVSDLLTKYGGKSEKNKRSKKPADSTNYKDILYGE